jgi:antitoxin HicB
MNKINIDDYPFLIRHLAVEDGGGYLIEYTDLPGCMSDGETIEEAIANGSDAVTCWMEAAKAAGREIPKPVPTVTVLEKQSGKWVQRVPKSMHQRLVKRAKEEGVSLNTLVVSMIAEGLGKEKSLRNHHTLDQ